MSPNYVLTISFEMVRKKLPYPLWRWDRYAYEEGLMAPLDATGSFIPGKSTSYIHSIYQTVMNPHSSTYPSPKLFNFTSDSKSQVHLVAVQVHLVAVQVHLRAVQVLL